MILLNGAESRELDRISQETYGIDSYLLMTRAGESVADALVEKFSESIADVMVVAGKGNNGGDGFVAGRRLCEAGFNARAILLGRGADLKGDAARAYRDFREGGGAVIEALDESTLEAAFKPRPSAVIDAIFGTGLNAEVRGIAHRAISIINSLEVPIVAVDISSGVNADTGAVMGIAVQAALTVTFGFAKFGHVSYPGAGASGELRIIDIGFAKGALDEIAPQGRFIEAGDVRPLIRRRPENSHKGMYGHPLVIAGSRGKSGAVLLASRAALRTGAGLVTAAVPQTVQPIVAAGQAELMTEAIADRDGHFDGAHAIDALRIIVKGKDSLIVGPGMGVSDDTKLLIEWLITEASEPNLPILIDADGLNALAEIGCDFARRARGPIVLTPHPGEASRLLGESTAAVNGDRISAARRIAQRTGACVMIKGARSVIASLQGIVLINSSGNPGMSTPGMGDALCGIVGALLAQSRSAANPRAPLDALALGVFLHGYAADRVAARIGRVGYITGDLIDELPAAIEAIAR
ncbi:MAG: NAD(P)H-hydrate dehydratase [Candidatus Binatus sp.]|uniref:NAD(P)H-hydrate dehydratase n=1 Tax=Candidatus Binatus sp. TaxID=2811406 RepID=UPI0027256541|nr:NAD(P)H-hydrate dehydratase [Candidatus Binatus sp.]MDO8434830.1 NAD(P)H-hydrate dehydratase [Candidatus Binatus sp.]